MIQFIRRLAVFPWVMIAKTGATTNHTADDITSKLEAAKRDIRKRLEGSPDLGRAYSHYCYVVEVDVCVWVGPTAALQADGQPV